MEAMSIETLLLSAWEEEGFVGRTRVPIGQSDMDVLAIHANHRKIRIGECKVRMGSRALYLVDDYSLAYMDAQPQKDFTAWMGEEWSQWLRNLPKLWDKKGVPEVPWLLPASQVEKLEVIFCCNVVVLCDPVEANERLRSAAARALRANPSLAQAVKRPGFVQGQIKPTVEVITDLAKLIREKIESGYGRRFADHFKDVFREINRYLKPDLDRLPCDRKNQTLGNRKGPHADRIRKETVLKLLNSLGVETDELREWIA